ncbi:MAG: methyltransferase [Candidatus Saccharibacteria bacterium]|nr:methyltransferase [Candidatus Saccharibacteria bacterium]
MRVISGKLGGRNFDSPPGNRTHPMSDKARGALFNALGDIKGLTVLDAFAGSGALSFEAISRGASQVTAIDIETSAVTTIRHNAEVLGVEDRIKVIRSNAAGWTKKAPLVERFDLVLCDPPYDMLQMELVERLAKRTAWGGLLVLSLPPDARVILPESFERLIHKSYGDIELHFYRHHAPAGREA